MSIGVSLLRGDFGTAGSVMFLLNLGSLLEEWTRKVPGRPGRCMSLNVDASGSRPPRAVLVPISQVRAGDAIVVHTGSVIPLDGKVLDGEASVNQASLTGGPSLCASRTVPSSTPAPSSRKARSP